MVLQATVTTSWKWLLITSHRSHLVTFHKHFNNYEFCSLIFVHFPLYMHFSHPLLCTYAVYMKNVSRLYTCLSLRVSVRGALTLIKKIQIASNPSASWALRNLKFCLNTAWWGNLNKTCKLKVRHEYNTIMSYVHDVMHSAFAKLPLGYEAFLFNLN